MGSECYSGKFSFLAKIFFFFFFQCIWNIKTGDGPSCCFLTPKITPYSHLFSYVISTVSRCSENYSYTLLFARSLAIHVTNRKNCVKRMMYDITVSQNKICFGVKVGFFLVNYDACCAAAVVHLFSYPSAEGVQLPFIYL